MDYQPVTRRSDLILGASCLSVFCALALFSSLERALVLSGGFVVFFSIIQTQPVEQRDKRFWRVIGGLALLHLPLLALVPLDRFPFGLVVLPFMLADGFAIWGLLKWTEKRFPRD